jgi:hypothetical protein
LGVSQGLIDFLAALNARSTEEQALKLNGAIRTYIDRATVEKRGAGFDQRKGLMRARPSSAPK